MEQAEKSRLAARDPSTAVGMTAKKNPQQKNAAPGRDDTIAQRQSRFVAAKCKNSKGKLSSLSLEFLDIAEAQNYLAVDANAIVMRAAARRPPQARVRW